MLFHDLPQARFNTIVIDPPWPISMVTGYTDPRHKKPKRLTYDTLSLDEIKSFPLFDLAEVGAHIYLWTTNKFLPAAFEVLKSWNVNYHLAMPMVKKSGIAPCCGYIFGAEYCLLGFAGRPMLRFTGIGKLNWLLTAPKARQHSVKPDAFYDLVEAMSPGPYLDVFARRHREGWICWGNQLPALSLSPKMAS